MKLYHYTARRFIPSIQENGIRLGHVPNIVNGQFRLIYGYIWLTTNEDCHQQEWAQGSLSYDRSEYRITVTVPERNVIRWLDFCATGKITAEAVLTLNAFGDPENWRLFPSRIEPERISAIDRKRIYLFRGLGE